MKKHLIQEVKKNSIAWEMEIEPGDLLLSVNSHSVEDIFDYQLLCEEENILVEVEKKNGEVWELEIEKDEDEDLGLIFENGLMDEYHSCCNKCLFCFIDQMPPGMRKTLYFKDDDSRLSFLQGNYVTLTNMSDADVSRVIRYHLAPINISVHTMDPELRCKMLHNRFAGDKLKYIRQFHDAGIEMNGQIVLCKGINDGKHLDETISKLTQYLPSMKSVSVVPAGLTKYREGLYPLQNFTKEDAVSVIESIEAWQKKIYEQHQIHFVHASDEWYIMAEREIPEEGRYDGYPQLENGVGMVRSFLNEAGGYLKLLSGDNRRMEVSTFTGTLAYPYLLKTVQEIQKKFPQIIVNVYPITNHFFGENITVTGLLTGQDIVNRLKNQKLGERLLVPTCTLKSGEDIFLDDMTLEQMEKNLQIEAVIVKSSGADFVKAVLGDAISADVSTVSRYEP